MGMGRGGALLVDITLVSVLLFGVLFVAAGPTGFLTLTWERNVTLSVQQEVSGELSSFTVRPNDIFLGNSTFIGVELTNTGTDPINATYTVRVYNENFTLLYTYPGPKKELAPGAFMARRIKHTPHETGQYIIELEADVGPETAQTAQFLDVDPVPVPPPPERITRVRKQLKWVQPAPLPTPHLVKAWNVSAPRNATIEQGGSTIIPIRIHNTGNATLTNVRIGLQHSGNLSLEFTPKIMFTIEPNTTRTFALEASVGNDTIGQQRIRYRISSAELSEKGTIPVTVVPTLTRRQLLDKIAALEAVLRELTVEMRLEQRQGADISQVNASVTRARQALREARTAVEAGNLREGRDRIEDAHRAIREAFQSLFKLQSEQFLLEAPLAQPLLVLILIAVVVAVLMVGAYYYFRERELERPKLLRDMEER